MFFFSLGYTVQEFKSCTRMKDNISTKIVIKHHMSKQAAITQSVSQADVPKDSNDMIITKGKIGKREGNQSQLDEEEQK